MGAAFLTKKIVVDQPQTSFPIGSDVLCFIGENPGLEKSGPGFFCLATRLLCITKPRTPYPKKQKRLTF